MITSQSNIKVKQIRKLQDKKERQHTGLFYAEGIRIIAEAVQTRANIVSIIYSPGLLVSDFARQLIVDIESNRKDIDLIELDAKLFRAISDKDNPQGIAAVVKQRWFSLEDISIEDHLWVALDEVQNPGNLGSILRTTDAVGGNGVILLDQTTDPYHSTAVRGSMGVIFSQKLIRTSLNEFSEWKKNNQWLVIGTSGSAEEDYQEVTYPEDLVLLMGSERQGLHMAHKKLCDRMVKIPMTGRSDSLNLAAATAVMLYEVYNQHRRRHRK